VVGSVEEEEERVAAAMASRVESSTIEALLWFDPLELMTS